VSFPDFVSSKKRFQKTTIKSDAIMKNSVLLFLTTSKGWIIRQALKYSGMGLVSLGAWVNAKALALGLPVDQVQAVMTPFHAFASAAVVLLVEVALSFLARKNP
jgi:hypothetical protein